jgi:hypothetical protein
MMAPEVGHAQIDEALTIQPIEVCDPSGGCATPSFDFGTMQQVLTSVWAQAGIAPVLLSLETLSMPIPTGQTGAMQVGLTTGADNIIPSPDGFRLLTRTAGNDQSTNPNTINLYIVNTLSPFVNGVPQSNQIARGISFINGNGIVIGSDAVLDTAAHELGHVLGLDHANFNNNSDPNNLMTGSPQGTRTIPTSINQIGPNGLDQLNATQIDRARHLLQRLVCSQPERQRDPEQHSLQIPSGRCGLAKRL